MRNQVKVHREVDVTLEDKDLLCLQRVTYFYESGESDEGYRFMRRCPKTKNQKALRGQSNVVSLEHIESLLKQAKEVRL